MKASIYAFLFIALLVQGEPTPAFRVLPKEFNADKENQMMRAYQRKQVHALLDQRLEELEQALQSKDEFLA